MYALLAFIPIVFCVVVMAARATAGTTGKEGKIIRVNAIFAAIVCAL